MTCTAFLDDGTGRLVSGDDKGHLILWNRNGSLVSSRFSRQNEADWIGIKWAPVSTTAKAHERGVTALAALGDIVVSGGSDSRVKVWKAAGMLVR